MLPGSKRGGHVIQVIGGRVDLPGLRYKKS